MGEGSLNDVVKVELRSAKNGSNRHFEEGALSPSASRAVERLQISNCRGKLAVTADCAAGMNATCDLSLKNVYIGRKEDDDDDAQSSNL